MVSPKLSAPALNMSCTMIKMNLSTIGQIVYWLTLPSNWDRGKPTR